MMREQARTTFQFFWENNSVPENFRSGVSLHSHTMCSEETLDVLPRYTGRIPVINRALDRNVDYNRAFWTPPLSPRQAYRLEEKQITRKLQLPALVSITDHDNIKAGMLLRVLDGSRHAPVSTEWTVPFGPTFFHLGVHNLPASDASGVMEELARFTANSDPALIGGMFSLLTAYPGVLTVLNHPLWDEKGIGAGLHAQTLDILLREHGAHIHSLELNGLRSWPENQRVIRLAQKAGIPSISGGDRHGREPNAILNLTAASNFREFIDEVRYARKSHVVFMPQYRESLNLRTMQTVIDVLRDYPETFQGRQTFPDRVYYRHPDSTEAVTLASLWPNGNTPAIFKWISRAVKIAEWRPVQAGFRLAWDDRGASGASSVSLEAETEIAI
jgi:hypothetical protein